MTQSTTQINACDVVIKLDNDGGVLQDISGSTNTININRLNRVGDGVRTFGSRFPLRAACGKDAEITMRAVYSGNELEAKQLLNEWYENHNDEARTLQVDIPDSDPGGDRYTFEVLLENLRIDVEAGNPDPVGIEANMKPTGTFTWAEIGS